MSSFGRVRKEEGGFALIIALAATIILSITVTAIVAFTSSNSRVSQVGQARQSANQIAEAGINQAYSILKLATNNAASPTRLGCSIGTGGSSDCTTKTVVCVAAIGTCPASQGTPGNAYMYGYFNGSVSLSTIYSDANVTSTTVPAYSWLVISIGYARNPTGAGVISNVVSATSQVTANYRDPANIAVWNHLYSTAPQGPGCELDLNGNNLIVDTPIYTVGDLCMSGENTVIQEASQPIDIMVNGSLVFSANGTKVGADVAHPITSAAVGLGCTTIVDSAGTSCPTNYASRYFVRATNTAQLYPVPKIDSSWYGSADPGPAHPCQTGTSPAPPAASTFDGDGTPNNSVVGTFDLTPSSSYTCQSTSGASTGQLSWNNATKILTINGVLYIDGSATVSQPATYTGRASLYLGGNFTMPGQNTTLCANAACSFTTWTPNTTDFMISALGTSVNFGGNNNIFQGGIFTTPGSTISFTGNNDVIQGPIVGGKFLWGNNTILEPLPQVTDPPKGAPISDNAHADAALPVFIKG